MLRRVGPRGSGAGIAERARKVHATGLRRIFKLSMGDPKSWHRGPGDDPVFAECIDSGIALRDFGGDFDWSDPRYDNRAAVLQRWCEDMNPDSTAYDPDIQATG